MPRLSVEKVPSVDGRTLPIFAEFDRLSDRIRMQAYNLFAHRGAADGRALDDWLAAEREVCWRSAELAERDGAYAISVALAGFEPKEISVTATPRELIIKAAHEHEKQSDEEGETKLRWSEFRRNDVFRRIEFPALVNVQKISATLENGLLKIMAPRAKPEAESATTVDVSTGS